MRKVLPLLVLALVICTLLPAAGIAEGQDVDSLTDWNLRIAVPEGAVAVLEGSEYYIYAGQPGSIPYVMVRTYGYEDPKAFLEEFTGYMKTRYANLQVTAEPAAKTVGGRECFETDYTYQVSGYQARDRRIVLAAQGRTYMFASKEIDELGLTVGSMLEDVVAGCEFLTDDAASQGPGIAQGYLYTLEDGMPGCWLDMTGIGEQTLGMHYWIPSGEGEFREQMLALQLSDAEVSEEGLVIHRVLDPEGKDLSDRFQSLTVQFYLDGALLAVERKGEAPEEEELIPAGNYPMQPVRVSADGEGNGKHFRPAEDGPYSPEELAAWARFCYFRQSGIFPQTAEVTVNPDDTYTVQLYAEVSPKDGQDTASLVRYTVDAYGEGKNETEGKTVSLMR